MFLFKQLKESGFKTALLLGITFLGFLGVSYAAPRVSVRAPSPVVRARFPSPRLTLPALTKQSGATPRVRTEGPSSSSLSTTGTAGTRTSSQSTRSSSSRPGVGSDGRMMRSPGPYSSQRAIKQYGRDIPTLSALDAASHTAAPDQPARTVRVESVKQRKARFDAHLTTTAREENAARQAASAAPTPKRATSIERRQQAKQQAVKHDQQLSPEQRMYNPDGSKSDRYRSYINTNLQNTVRRLNSGH